MVCNINSTVSNKYQNLYYNQVYPEKEWIIFKTVNQLPKGFWNNKSNHRLFLDYFAKEHNITSIDDWKSVSTEDIISLGGRGLLRQYPSFSECLKNGK